MTDHGHEEKPSEAEAGETISLGAAGTTPDEGDAWDALLDQLRERGPGHTRYVFEGEVARGGMGLIHRVFDRDVRRRLALKVMLGQADGSAADDASLGRFLEEAQVAGQLDHPGIVPVHEIGVDAKGQVYFTMKLVKGEDLRAVFERVRDPGDDEWTTTRALNVMLRVCEAMAYAHDKGVIHRDLKPGNVMVGKYGEAYVMDWGLAKVLSREDPRARRRRVDATEFVETIRQETAADTPDSPLLSVDGAVVGTPAYMPPEQAFGHLDALGPPADVYAVGAMLYHLLAGRMPYTDSGDGVSARMILLAVTEGAPRPLAQLAPDAPAELAAIVEKAMAREIPDRYADMTALARDLRAYLEDRVVAAYETGARAELKKWVQRNKALAMAVAAAAIVVAGLTYFFVQRLQDERNVAIANEEEAIAERDRVLRLSDKRRLDVLVAEAHELWPAHPENLEALRGWQSRAERLLERLPLHEATLDEVRRRGTPRGGSSDGTPAHARAYDFEDDDDARWWHDAVRDLVIGLHALNADDVHGATVAGIAARASWAEAVAEKTTTGPEAAAAWADAREAIRAHSMYGGLDLKPQLGLVPLGPDPESMLWEFGHAQTGDLPRRDPVTGRLSLDEETGLVFVLVPGGTVRIGAQGDDPDAARYDPHAFADESPIHEVTLAPYFLSKYEMTQGQWARFTGTNPSYYQPGLDVVLTSRHPVEDTSWEMCRETLSCLGLVLPTEAQWETACRAGTETPWSTGLVRDSLEGAANLADQAARQQGATWKDIQDWPELDDGYAVHAPVGSYRANPFGMHDMHGNVWEWCRDAYAGSAQSVTPNEGDGMRDVPGAAYRTMRGGGFMDRASEARSAARGRDSPEFRGLFLGLRPVMVCD